MWSGVILVACRDQCGPWCHDGRLCRDNNTGAVASPDADRHEHDDDDDNSDT